MGYKVVPIPRHDGSTRTAYELSNGTQTWEALPGLWFVAVYYLHDIVVEAVTHTVCLLWQPEGKAARLLPFVHLDSHKNMQYGADAIKAFLTAHPEFVQPNSIRPTEF